MAMNSVSTEYHLVWNDINMINICDEDVSYIEKFFPELAERMNVIKGNQSTNISTLFNKVEFLDLIRYPKEATRKGYLIKTWIWINRDFVSFWLL